MRSLKRIVLVILALLILAISGGFFYLLLRDTEPPEIALTPTSGPVSKKTVFRVLATDQLSGLKSLNIKAIRGEGRFDLSVKAYPDSPAQVRETFTLDTLTWPDGPVDIEVTATDASFAKFRKGNTGRIIQNYILDTIPPRITIKNPPSLIQQGGSAVVSYSLSEEPVTNGVLINDLFIPGFRREKGDYLCIFPFPFFVDKSQYQPILTAADQAGNEARQGLTVTAKARKFREDTINLTDAFLKRKMPEFEAEYPGQMSHLERFLKVNRESRKKEDRILKELSKNTEGRILWEGPFLRLPGAATTAGFGDQRKYVRDGQVVDQQVHNGVDLASTENAPVPAANSGRVVFADNLGIYGKLVVLDHGLGLQTLYAHLSEIRIKIGDEVKKGQHIGLTGATGLAGGDHLHFSLLIGGIPVTPVEWWDEHWLRQNVLERLK